MNQKHCHSDSVYLEAEPALRGVKASPPLFNWKEQPRYVPPKRAAVRPGAEDALKIKSKGYPT